MTAQPAITLDLLPATYGDCIWVECHGAGRPWRLLVDAGPPEAWPRLEARIEALPRADRRFDLVIVSHIDSDHIGGVLSLLSDTALGVEVGDVWFNALHHLPDAGGQTRGAAQGESLAAILGGAHGGLEVAWNAAFGGGPVVTGGDGQWVEPPLPGGPRLTLLSPTPKRLVALRKVWEAELARLRARQSSPETPRDRVRGELDLAELAARRTSNDAMAPNGSSIAVLIEHRGASCLLSADAFPNVLGAALLSLARQRGVASLRVDAFKLPHHGSQGNVTAPLLGVVRANHYLVSTNGDRFDHPDDTAIARVITRHGPGHTLGFNYATDDTRRWDAPDLKSRYGYETIYPDHAAAGLRLELPAR